MNIYSENATHRTAVSVAEGMRQVAVSAAGANQAAVIAAEIAFYRTCLASAKANSCETATFVTALMALGAR